MKTSKKIAGVSVNTEVLPTKQELIESALQTKEFYRMPKADALVKIKKEIDKSGLFKTVSPKPNELHNDISGAVKKVDKPKRNK